MQPAVILLAPRHGLVATPACMDDASRAIQFAMALHAQALYTGLVFFGGFDVVIGILILRADFLSRAFGAVMVLAGPGWLVYLWPPLAMKLAMVVQPFGFLAEAALLVWLLTKGVDEERWRPWSLRASAQRG